MTIDIDPIIATLGPFVLSWHGLLTSLAVVVVVAIAVRRAPRRGLTADDIYGVAFWAILGGIVGARALHVIDFWEFYASRPQAILALTEGGLAFYGAAIGAVLFGVAYALWRRLPVGRLLDIAAVGIPAAHIVGRIGCIINGDAFGTYVQAPWAFVYTHPASFAPLGLPTHPYPVYEMAWNLATIGILLAIERFRPRDGVLFLSYACLYAVGRFALSYYRTDAVVAYGLQQAQIVSILVLAAALPLLVYLNLRKGRARGTGEMPRPRAAAARRRR